MHTHHSTPTLQQLLYDAEELLRCAKATAYESADTLHGSQRDHAFAAVHLIEMAREKLNTALHVENAYKPFATPTVSIPTQTR
ncbi:DUF6124 family protein [Pseudomonas sp. NPDC007930]|uniref:DUF6124 family protein n=1 Tax=Pseudomonas sp. NPDC007930 TaxID=3364417 RepID=UPI0036E2F143